MSAYQEDYTTQYVGKHGADIARGAAALNAGYAVVGGYGNIADLQCTGRPETQIESLNGSLRGLRGRIEGLIENADRSINRIAGSNSESHAEEGAEVESCGGSINETVARVERLNELADALADQINRLVSI